MRGSSRVRLWTALWIVYLVWGSTYLGIKIAVRTLPPLLTAGTRFLAAAGILALIAVAARRALRVAPTLRGDSSKSAGSTSTRSSRTTCARR